ncbi:hypothetical protein DCCM_4320 [Desulfocucumis palustris]|uniref:Uncharacterized protein n=1 Tax=Desulfocucumis palustris TaxID=1898651 RepID=A0A2L2XFT3_9FIRM|nr:hypothetical protein DCCM_4320 [Desulfocucumis palustris]
MWKASPRCNAPFLFRRLHYFAGRRVLIHVRVFVNFTTARGI